MKILTVKIVGDDGEVTNINHVMTELLSRMAHSDCTCARVTNADGTTKAFATLRDA